MQFKNILFPVDFSESSRALNPEVEFLARRFHAQVTLMHVFEIPFTWYGSGEAPLMNTDCLQQYIGDVRRRLAQYKIDLPEQWLCRMTAEGDPAWQIKNYVSENNIDLVVMGTHGYGVLRRVLLGSVAMKVLHDVTCPVWTHAPGQTADPSAFAGVKQIACAVELNNEAVPLLRFVSQIAEDFGATVRLIHSVPDNASRPYRYFDTDLHRFLVKQADEDIAVLQETAGTHFSVDLVEDPIPQAIATIVGQHGADLVIIGRGRSQEIFGTLRTHAYDIIRQSQVPVLSYCAPEIEPVKKPVEDTEHQHVLSSI